MTNNKSKTCKRVDDKIEWQPVIDCMEVIGVRKKPYLPRNMKLVQLKKEHQAILMRHGSESNLPNYNR